MRRSLATAGAVIAGYLVVSCVLHYLVFPEPDPDPQDIPRSGTVLENAGIKSRFVYRRSSIETAGRLFEWDNYVEPGGGPIDIPHVHPRMRETFEVVDGEIRFVIDGQERIVTAGSNPDR
jgi:mannose-6-phosphate isomerase-like protein (cupin superfamily)